MKTRIAILKCVLQLGCLLMIFSSCKKNWLDAKNNQSLVVPQTLRDFQGILNNTNLFNSNTNALGNFGSDDYIYLENRWQTASAGDKNIHTWAPTQDFYQNFNVIYEWNTPYTAIFSANVVLEGLKKIKPASSDLTSYSEIKGTALFYRAIIHFNLAQIFCKPYISSSAGTDLGLILRDEADVNIKSVRSTVLQTYDFIEKDLLQARNLLPTNTVLKTSPTKLACLALLSRFYLSKSEYSKALSYADSCLNINDTLLDYNDIDGASSSPFSGMEEVIYYSVASSGNLTPISSSRSSVDPALYNLYDANDLRKKLFFNVMPNNTFFKGSYGPLYYFLFSGLAIDEIYLTKAECLARQNDNDLALKTLNRFLKTRWNNSVTFNAVTTTNTEETIKIIILERRKQLLFRGLRWTDLRRLNLETRFAKTLTRTLLGVTYTLLPNDNRYVYPFPNEEVLRSGVVQNPRP